jgi:CheY-like chemotaxis protein
VETILLVEDSRLLKMAMKHSLAEAGFNVVDAADGEEALRLARSTRPDVVVLDIMLPRLAGDQVLRSLKKDPVTAKTPVLVVSALSQNNAERLKAEGAVAYIEKSKIDLNNGHELVRIVKAVLKKTERRANTALATN